MTDLDLTFEQVRIVREDTKTTLLVGFLKRAQGDIAVILAKTSSGVTIVPIRNEELDRVIDGLKRLRELAMGPRDGRAEAAAMRKAAGL